MISRLVIKRRELFAGGHEFPITGAYEKLVGKVYGEVDPKARLNRIIVNLDKAPRNRRGRIEYSSDVRILKPVDMARGNGKIFFDAPNRGGKRSLSFLNDAPEANDPSSLDHAGNGFLMRQGYTSSQQHTNQLDPELFPHAYNVIKDAQTGRRDGILKRPKTDPLVFHTQTSTEYWQKRGCLAHTDGKGNDLPVPDNVRIYVIASAQHNSPVGSEPVKDDSQFPINPLPAGDALRALMVAMDLWVTKGIEPPPSRYPTVADHSLVAPNPRTGFPKIPGVNFIGLYNRQLFLDYGRNITRGKISVHPPKPIGNGAYKILVPKVDPDGNDVAGIRLPRVQVPVGTYTGWNLRPRGLAEGELAGLLGSFIPFAKTKAARRKIGDPRLSLEERYVDRDDYVRQLSRAARLLVEQRYLLAEDAERILNEAKTRRVP